MLMCLNINLTTDDISKERDLIQVTDTAISEYTFKLQNI